MRSEKSAIRFRAALTTLTALGFAFLSGCASYSGSSLVAGTSSEADILALMGPPDEKVKLDAGATEWFYTRPAGRQTIAITVGPDGRFRSSEQRLQRRYIDQIRRDTWTTKEVRTLLGPPIQTARFERQQRDVWTYRWQEYSDYWELDVQFSYDGVVREVLNLRDMERLQIGPGVFLGGGVSVSGR
ncbi:MAG: hypothetical protein P8Y76_03875 [bacterium]|jgi:hypothetical protein